MKFKDKRDQWNWIKDNWPELKLFLLEINDKMGKPQWVKIDDHNTQKRTR